MLLQVIVIAYALPLPARCIGDFYPSPEASPATASRALNFKVGELQISMEIVLMVASRPLPVVHHLLDHPGAARRRNHVPAQAWNMGVKVRRQDSDPLHPDPARLSGGHFGGRRRHEQVRHPGRRPGGGHRLRPAEHRQQLHQRADPALRTADQGR
ncbi:MAG: hypothetical protein MZW92_49360 [Comamonadaceae bacterium]|nr:hypothetical protein [Comamonadaceae bacterium]